ncbi:hypothetical protein [uncultured Flavobacterium sp.]|uniref:hypothetical protein n=1 Tax=uncultured Flavobacterium sp. TaxID=165435 RepID=UPI0025FDDFC6|nr:hypothetical protein [uncultured Flavobacterium sp.]
MKKIYITITFLYLIMAFGCGSKKTIQDDMAAKVRTIDDSIRVGDMTIRNAFKQQLLAHSGGTFDSLMIHDKVYRPNRYVFDNCLGMIFGDENGKKFRPPGMYEWNRTLLSENDSLLKVRLAVLNSVNINELFTRHLTAVQELTGQKGSGSWMVYFGPKNFQIFGGCDNHAMVLDMFGDAWNTKDINEVFAHEIEHLVFGPILEKDPHGGTGLGVTLDEGLAVYFTYAYLKQSLDDALYGKDTQLLYDREKEILQKLEPYFYKSGDQGLSNIPALRARQQMRPTY